MNGRDEFTDLMEHARRAARREGLTNEDAEDIASMAILTYWQSEEAIRKPIAWIRLVAKRKAWRLRLRHSMRRDIENRDLACHFLLRDDSSDTVDELLDLRAAFSGLRQHECQTVLRRDVEGASLEAIAESTGLSRSTVKRRLQRGRESLRRALSGRLIGASFASETGAANVSAA